MRLRFLLAAVAVLSASLIARADTLQAFAVNGILQTGSFSGTFIVDTTDGTVSTGDFQVSDGVSVYDFSVDASSVRPGFSHIYGQLGLGEEAFYLVVPQSFVNYTGGEICTISANCQNAVTELFTGTYTVANDAISGNVTPTPAPEPSSFLLLGTGVLGTVGALRRRLEA